MFMQYYTTCALCTHTRERGEVGSNRLVVYKFQREYLMTLNNARLPCLMKTLTHTKKRDGTTRHLHGAFNYCTVKLNFIAAIPFTEHNVAQKLYQ